MKLFEVQGNRIGGSNVLSGGLVNDSKIELNALDLIDIGSRSAPEDVFQFFCRFFSRIDFLTCIGVVYLF